jgi:succinate dehydrogenase hydrophobic anchor subunit
VLGRMQYSWYRIVDLSFLTLGMYHGLNGVWGIFRDYQMKPWLKISVVSALVLFGIAFTVWGYSIIFSIPYLKSLSLN